MGYFDQKLFIPEWFLDSRPRGVGVEAAFPAADGFNDMAVGDYLIHEDYGVGMLNNILSGDGCGSNDLPNVLGMTGNVCPMYGLTVRLRVQIVAENELF